MKFESDVVITGAKSFSGMVDGNLIDFTKVYAETQLKDGVGSATVEYKWGGSANYKTLENQKFPLNATAEFELVTNGSKTSTQLLNLVIDTY